MQDKRTSLLRIGDLFWRRGIKINTSPSQMLEESPGRKEGTLSPRQKKFRTTSSARVESELFKIGLESE